MIETEYSPLRETALVEKAIRGLLSGRSRELFVPTMSISLNWGERASRSQFIFNF